jgi:hypothetical protein
MLLHHTMSELTPQGRPAQQFSVSGVVKEHQPKRHQGGQSQPNMSPEQPSAEENVAPKLTRQEEIGRECAKLESLFRDMTLPEQISGFKQYRDNATLPASYTACNKYIQNIIHPSRVYAELGIFTLMKESARFFIGDFASHSRNVITLWKVVEQ